MGFLLLNKEVCASTQENHKALEVINRFNAIKSYKYRARIYSNDQLVGHVEASYLFPYLLRSKKSMLINQEEVESLTIINANWQWIYHPSRQTVEQYKIPVKAGKRYQAIDNFINSTLKIEYVGIRSIDNQDTHLIRAFNEEDKNGIKYYDLYFDVKDGVLKEIETYIDSKQTEVRVFEKGKVHKMLLDSPAIRLKQVFYDYQFNVKIDPKEFRFVKPRK